MNIVFDYQIFSLQYVGGISRYFVELAERLSHSSLQCQTTVLAPLHINEYLHFSSVKTLGTRIAGFPGKHYILPSVNRLISNVLLRKFKVTIFHETYYSNYAQRVRAPRILTVYDMIHERYPEQFSGPDLAIPKHKAAAVARADHIIAISQSTRADIISYLKVPEEKISVIPLASSIGKTSSNDPEMKKRRPYLLFVGLRRGVKNFAILLKAYAYSKFLRNDFDLVCVGGGGFTPAERHDINREGLVDRVKQVNANDNQLERLYSEASLFIYPSLYEGFGLPLLEAMRCGCPVACSNTSSMPEIAGDCAAYFDPLSVDNMQTVIEEVVQSENSCQLLRSRGYEREKLFSWEQCVEKTAGLYRNFV